MVRIVRMAWVMTRDPGHPQSDTDDSLEAKPTYRICAENQLIPPSLGTLWTGPIATGAEAGRTVRLRRMDLSSFTTAELETVLSCAKNAVSISHPNLCKLLGVVIENGELITVSEQLPLTSILDILGYVIHQGKPISPAVSLRLVTNAIAATLAVRKVWCTQIGVTVERLVLSECLYVTDLGDVMLSEVGILPVIARCRGMMKNPSVVVQFAPEELKRAPFDESAVVYSFALLLWEFLANRRFFSSLTRSEARRSVLSQPVPTLLGCERLMAPEYGQLISIIERATCREPKLRIKTLADLHLELTSLPRTCIASDTEVAFVLRDLMQALRRPRPLSKTEVSKRPIVQARHVMRSIADTLTLEDDVPTFEFYRPKTVTQQPKVRDDSAPGGEVREMSKENSAPNRGASYRFHHRTSDMGALVSVWTLALFIFVSPMPLGYCEDSAWSTNNVQLADSKIDESYPLPSRIVDAVTWVDPSIGDDSPGPITLSDVAITVKPRAIRFGSPRLKSGSARRSFGAKSPSVFRPKSL